VVDVAGVDQLADELALLGRARQGREKREQLLAVPRPGIVLERPPERQVLGFGLFRDFVHIRRNERERKRRVAFVLRKMKADAADHVPDGVLLFQIALETVLVPCGLGSQGFADVGPQLSEQRGRDQLCPLHGRR
jgi:hypothetical protein